IPERVVLSRRGNPPDPPGLEAFEGLGVDTEQGQVALGGLAMVLDGARNIDRCTEDCEGPADEAARNFMACIRHGGSPLCCLQCGVEAAFVQRTRRQWSYAQGA